MITVVAGLITEGMALAKVAIQAEMQKGANEMALLGLMTPAQQEKYLDQIMADRERRSKNLEWWQNVADKLGNLFDGDGLADLTAKLKLLDL
jgi:hypothetical protein